MADHINGKVRTDLPDGLLSATMPYHELKAKCDELLRARQVLGADNIVLRDQIPNAQAARDVLAERQRQISAEGWTPEHDDEHNDASLAKAAACYANAAAGLGWKTRETPPTSWPLYGFWWKHTDSRKSLVKAGALILAEIERLDRRAAKKSEVS